MTLLKWQELPRSDIQLNRSEWQFRAQIGLTTRFLGNRIISDRSTYIDRVAFKKE